MRWSTKEHDVAGHVTASTIEDPFLPFSFLSSFSLSLSVFFLIFVRANKSKSALRVRTHVNRLLHSPPIEGGAKNFERRFAGQIAVCEISAKNRMKTTAFSAAKILKRRDCVQTKNMPTRAALRCLILNIMFFCRRLGSS